MQSSKLRVRISHKDIHYGGQLVCGSKVLEFFGDIEHIAFSNYVGVIHQRYIREALFVCPLFMSKKIILICLSYAVIRVGLTEECFLAIHK